MAKKGANPPPAPDPYATSRAQTGSNVDTAVANAYIGNANENSPYGNVQYTKTGSTNVSGFDVPSFQRDVSLAPAQQTLLDQQNELGFLSNNIAGDQLSRINDLISQPVSPERSAEETWLRTNYPNHESLQPGGKYYGSSPSLPARTDSISPPPSLARMGAGPQLRDSLGPATAQAFSGHADRLQTGFDDVGGAQRSVGPTDYSEDRRRVEDALYSRINPQLERDKAALENRLVNQGFQTGSTAFNDAMDEGNRQANDARMGVIREGGAEQSRLAGLDFNKFSLENAAQQQDFGQAQARGTFANEARTGNFSNDIAANQAYNAGAGQIFDQNATGANFANATAQQKYANDIGQTQYNNSMDQQDFANRQSVADFGNTARERAMQEQFAYRNQPIAEISSLMNGGQPTAPQFSPFKAGQVAPTDVSGNVYNSANINAANWRQGQQTAAAGAGGLYGLGGAAIGGLAKYGLPMVSERSMKTEIVRVATNPLGLGIYTFRYKSGGPMQTGFMADEVETAVPHAVNDVLGVQGVLVHLAERAA